jgi:hypothetical protein
MYNKNKCTYHLKKKKKLLRGIRREFRESNAKHEGTRGFTAQVFQEFTEVWNQTWGNQTIELNS